MKTVVIYSVYVVGMHHYGSRQLEVGAGYRVRHEPDNVIDPNALAVFKHEQKCGYIKREQSSALVQLFNSNVIQSRVFLKPKFEPVIKNRRKGPEQRCNMGFRCSAANVDKVKDLLSGHFLLKII